MISKTKTLSAVAVLGLGVAFAGSAAAMPKVNFGGIGLPANVMAHADGDINLLIDGLDLTDTDTYNNIQIFGRVSDIFPSTLNDGELEQIGQQTIFGGTYDAATNNPAGRELTYAFDIQIQSISGDALSGFEIIADETTSITYWLDDINGPTAYDGTIADFADAANGTPWLTATLLRDERFFLTATELQHVADVGPVVPADTGIYFTVTGGQFGNRFDTNLEGDADFITNSISLSGLLDIDGTTISGSFTGDTSTEFQAISEPATLGMLGMGLAGIAFAGRRRKS